MRYRRRCSARCSARYRARYRASPRSDSPYQGPVGSIKRSASMVRQTWGRQITASFGFQLVYLIAGVIAILPALLFFAIFPILGIIVGVFTVSMAIGIVGALEGIFKAALYEYALGEKPIEFNTEVLKGAYMTDLRAQPGR